MRTLLLCVNHSYIRCFATLMLNISVLDPFSKGKHIEKHWGKPLYDEALKRLETLVCIPRGVRVLIPLIQPQSTVL